MNINEMKIGICTRTYNCSIDVDINYRIAISIIVLVLVLIFVALHMWVAMLVLAFALSFAILFVLKGYTHGNINTDISIGHSLSVSSKINNTNLAAPLLWCSWNLHTSPHAFMNITGMCTTTPHDYV